VVIFISHPGDKFRLGDFLKESLADTSWTSFRAAIAFAKRSGTKHVKDALADFTKRASVNITVGIDSGGTSAEGLLDLIQSVRPKGDLWIFHNENSSTFHPKIFLFKNSKIADLVVGSGNLTEGGLYTNYEAGIRLKLNLDDPDDRLLIKSIEASLNEWSTAHPTTCVALNESLLKGLVKSQKVLPEILTRETEESGVLSTAKSKYPQKKHVFGTAKVQKAPKVLTTFKTPKWLKKFISQAKKTGVTGGSVGARTFLMTLQNTDVGIGKKTPGASGRSPEIFIPIGAVDADPAFWGWPDLFTIDKKWSLKHAKWISGKGASSRRSNRPLDKMDRNGARFRTEAGATVKATIWYNPDKVDLRIRNKRLRAAGNVDDILMLGMAPTGAPYDYTFGVVRPSDHRFAQLNAACSKKVAANSKKRYGYI